MHSKESRQGVQDFTNVVSCSSVLWLACLERSLRLICLRWCHLFSPAANNLRRVKNSNVGHGFGISISNFQILTSNQPPVSVSDAASAFSSGSSPVHALDADANG